MPSTVRSPHGDENQTRSGSHVGFPAYNPMMQAAQQMRPMPSWGVPNPGGMTGFQTQRAVNGPQMDPQMLQGLGQNPALNPLEAAQKMLSPEQMAKMQQMLQDPAVRQKMQELAIKAQQGLLRPEDLNMLAQNLPQAMAGQEDLTAGKLMAILIGATASGMLFSKGLNLVMDTHKDPNGFVTKVLKGIDNLPFVKDWNTKINAQVKANTSPLAHPWLGLQGGVTHEDTIQQYLYQYLNPNTGHLVEELKTLGLSTQLKKELQNAKTLQDLQRVMELDPLHLLPQKVEGLVRYSPELTLQSIDKLAHREAFLQWLGESKQFAPKELNKIKELMDAPWLERIPVVKNVTQTQSLGEHFYDNLQALLKGSKHPDLVKKIKTVTGLTPQSTVAHIEKAINANAKMPSVWEEVTQSIRRVCSVTKMATKDTTMGQLKNHLEHYHLLNKVAADKRNGVNKLLIPLLKRMSFLNGHHVPVIAGKYDYFKVLDKNGVGPIGKMVGKAFFHLQRILDGANMNVMTNFGNKAIKDTPSFIGRAWISLFVMGFAFLNYQTAPKESKKSRFAEGLATGIFDYLGFEMARNWLTETKLLTRNAKIAKLLNHRFLRKFTFMGLASELILPGLVASVFGKAATSISHLFFGDPEKIEAAVAAKKSQASPQTQPKLVTQGQTPQQVQAKGTAQQAASTQAVAQPQVQPPALLPESSSVLSPQNTGLTPQQIAFNPSRARDAQTVQTLASEMPHFNDLVSGAIWSH